jgi:hypothetical protein
MHNELESTLKHRDENRIALYFEKKNQELIQQVKQING